MKNQARYLAHGAIIAALYAVLTHMQNLLLPGSATWAIQMRLSEVLCILAFFTPAAVPGLSIGCLLFNLTFSAALPLDFLLDYEEEVYRYPVKFESDDTFPFAKVGFPDGYKWRSGWMDIPIYEYEGHIIWGLTGRMTRWFLDHLRKAGEEETT